MTVAINKKNAQQLVILMLPEFVEVFVLFQRRGGWLKIPEPMLAAKDRLKVHNYVDFYSLKDGMQGLFVLALFSQQDLKELSEEEAKLTVEEKQAVLNYLSGPEFIREMDEVTDDLVQEMFEPSEQSVRRFEALTDDEKTEAIKRAQYFYCFIFLFFFNSFAVMVHGEDMYALVSKAVAGDDDAFAKAVHIDRSLTQQHKYFIDRKFRASNEGDYKFLKKINYRETSPGARGRIKYPGVWMMFSMLDQLNCLFTMSHAELLDIQEGAGMDRFQRPIDDVNAITKQLIDYRRYQTGIPKSMQ